MANIKKVKVNGNVNISTNNKIKDVLYVTSNNKTTDIFDIIYPIGTIIQTTVSPCPLQTAGIGTWTQLSDANNRFLLSSTSFGQTGGYANQILPKHSHSYTFTGHASHSHSAEHYHTVDWNTSKTGLRLTNNNNRYYLIDPSCTGKSENPKDYSWKSVFTSFGFKILSADEKLCSFDIVSSTGNHRHNDGYLYTGKKKIPEDLTSTSNTNYPPYYTVYTWVRTA